MRFLFGAAELLEVFALFLQNSLESFVVENDRLHTSVALLFELNVSFDNFTSFNLVSNELQNRIVVLKTDLILTLELLKLSSFD